MGTGEPAELTATSAPADTTPTNAPVSATPSQTVDGIAELTLNRIDVNPRQPRRTFDDASLSELAASLRTNGLIQPIVVRPVGERFELIAGERRYRAAKLAGLSAVPVIVRHVDDYTQAQWALVENIHREDLNPVERAEAYAGLMNNLGLTQAELAARLGEQRSSVANYLRLLDLADPVRELIRTGQLTLGHAKVLAGVNNLEDQAFLANQCVAEGASVRELERLSVMMPPGPKVDPNPTEPTVPTGPTDASDTPQAHFAELEQQLIQHLGVRVQLRRGKKTGTGQIVLHYGNLDEFDELVRRWGISLRSE